MTDTADFILPSNPADRRKIKDAVYEVVAVMGEIKDKQSYIKDVKTEMKEKFQIPPKVFAKMAKTYKEANIDDVRAENETFTTMFEQLFESNVGSTSAASTYSADDAE